MVGSQEAILPRSPEAAFARLAGGPAFHAGSHLVWLAGRHLARLAGGSGFTLGSHLARLFGSYFARLVGGPAFHAGSNLARIAGTPAGRRATPARRRAGEPEVNLTEFFYPQRSRDFDVFFLERDASP